MSRLTIIKKISSTQQDQFASLSGDFNPIHVDANLARRELFGETVVHGMHLVLASLNAFIEQVESDDRFLLTSVKGKFFSPALIDKEFSISIEYDTSTINIAIRDRRSLLLAEMIVAYRVEKLRGPMIISKSFEKTQPDKRNIQHVSDLGGQCKLHLDRKLCGRLFPSISGLNEVQVAEILSWTWIVGMKCPGQQSIFSGLDMYLDLKETDQVYYNVKRVIEKFSMVDLEVNGPSLKGTLATFFRPLATHQPSMPEISQLVSPGIFNNLKALVIGGSRGIGETTAKIIAAGGGKATVTYNTGKEDARRVRDEICEAGFDADLIAMDISDFEGSLRVLQDKNAFNAIFYYPSPRILRSTSFDKQLFGNFLFYYVEQFEKLVKTVKSSTTGNLVIFYPSTISITEKTPGFTEYIMAKSAGEYLCESLSRDSKNIDIYIERLPRLQTDQTMNLQNTPSQSTSTVMLPIILRISEMIDGSTDKVY